MGSSVTSLTYDVENRVTNITYPGGATNSFAYNGNDLRTKKVDSAGTKNFLTDGASPASAVLSDGAATYTPGLSERRGTASKFYHADALGSTRGITDSTQATTDSQLYDAFGMTVSRTGTTPTPFGFVGKSQYQTDSDSGLQLLGHRYYDPSIGRFLSSDPAQAGTNWYAYCDNNPVKETDPTGLQPPPLSSVTTPHGQVEMVEIAIEAGEAIPKPVFPNPTAPGLIRGGISNMGKAIIGWGTKALGAVQALQNLKADDINRMIDSGMTSQYARQLADFYYQQYWYMLQHNASNEAIGTPIERFRLMEMVAHRLEFIEKLRH